MPDPELRQDDVLVQVHAAGVNPIDSKIKDGDFKLIHWSVSGFHAICSFTLDTGIVVYGARIDKVGTKLCLLLRMI
jgi:NADPH:quinone reductase-like Zn-dependent oxidoreductase